jgi:hypothetical protein
LADCLPVAEIPSLQLFDCDTVQNLEWSPRRAGLGHETDGSGVSFQSLLQGVAVIVVQINDHENQPTRLQHPTVGLQPVRKASQQRFLAPVRVDLERRVTDQLWDKDFECRLHGRLLCQDLEVGQWHQRPAARLGMPELESGSPTLKCPSIQRSPSTAPCSMNSRTP